VIKDDVIAVEPNGPKHYYNSNQNFLFICNSFVGFPSPRNMIKKIGSAYIKSKENGSPYISSKVTIKIKVLNTLILIRKTALQTSLLVSFR
jgi:hypothetical protein